MRSELRLHPATLLFGLWTQVKNFAVPGILVVVGASRSSGPGDVSRWMPGMPPWMSNGWEVWLLVLLIPAALVTVARYLSFRLRYEEHEIVIRTGLIFRNERHVPYSRIQNVDAIQNVFHTPGLTTFGALILGVVIFKTGWFFLQSFATPLPPPPDPGTLRKVKLLYRCQVCGTEVRMTAANNEDPEPPRHCMDDMALVTPIE